MIPLDTRTKVRYTFKPKKKPLTVVLNGSESVVINPKDEMSLVSGRNESEAIEGSLIRQIFKNGKVFGNDYDGRLGVIETYLSLQDIYKDKVILDLGSNAGHFPIEYIRWGAQKVIAIEGRKDFEDQWDIIKEGIHSVDTSRIEWITADVREFEPDFDYDILSCLGLVYHLNDPWNTIRKYFKSQFIILESQVAIGESRTVIEDNTEDDRTKGLVPQRVDFFTLEDFENKLNQEFPQYISHRLYAYYWTEMEREMIFAERENGGYIIVDNYLAKPKARGLWLLERNNYA